MNYNNLKAYEVKSCDLKVWVKYVWSQGWPQQILNSERGDDRSWSSNEDVWSA